MLIGILLCTEYKKANGASRVNFVSVFVLFLNSLTLSIYVSQALAMKLVTLSPRNVLRNNQALRSELVDREAVDKARSSSKKSRQGKVKMKSAKGGNARVEARLEAKKYRRPARRTGSETYVEEDEDENSL